jgi:hypothetical protein
LSTDLDTRRYRYIIGIDLGTTNSALAYVDLAAQGAAAPDAPPTIQIFDVPQLTAPGVMGTRPVLPSFLYLPGDYDLPAGSTDLPWSAEHHYLVGEGAREQGARVPGRLVASAKSWLAHGAVDRTAPILPWGAAEEVQKVSPVEASKRYLQHLREAWNATIALGHIPEGEPVEPGGATARGEIDDDARFENQFIVLTVPASFDEVARELTLTAAHEAGLARVVLLEEPLAAFYAWLARHEQDWQSQMQDGQLILVCDIGGGTSDFTAIGVAAGEQGLRFNRLAVGEHLLLGGDNMDLALGRHIELKLFNQPGKLDAARWHQLVQQCRKAKERLLGAPEKTAAVDITVVGTGRSLIGSTLKSNLTQAEVDDVLLDGFFPQVGLDAPLQTGRRAGLAELGLPYVQDPAITRHLADFWRRFRGLLATESGRADPYPDYLLFNGGVLEPAPLRRRITELVGSWFTAEAGAGYQPTELPNPRLDLAVALGAAYYGLVRQGEGVRVGSGSPRTYYVAVEMPKANAQEYGAVCLLPRGTEEGAQVTLTEPEFAALTNQPVTFQIYASSTRLGDQLGEVVTLDAGEVTVLPPIRTILHYGRRGVAQQLPVQLAVRLTEIGTLELWCQSKQSDHSWQLAFDVRGEAEAAQPSGGIETIVEAATLEAAQAAIRRTFGDGSDGNYAPEGLRKRLESILELEKEAWPTSLIRKLADTFLEVADGRKRSFQHEAFWLNLLGFCLRPGYGDPGDELRMKTVWGLYLEGMNFNRPQVRTEWWIFWRRVAGGLKAGHQLQIYEQVRAALEASNASKKSGGKSKGKGSTTYLSTAEELEVWLALANFERLPANVKVSLGRTLLGKLRKNKSDPNPKELWALSRFGARTAMYGPLDRLVPATEATAWVEGLLALELERRESVGRVLVHLANRTGDRGRDVPEEVRTQVAAWLAPLKNSDHLQELLADADSGRSEEEQAWVFGEALPAGLVLA